MRSVFTATRSVLFLFLAVAASGCLMQPYSVEAPGNTTDNNTSNSSTGTTVVVPVNDTCLGPVCGADGRTYETDCEAYDAGANISYVGACRPPEPPCNDSDGMNPDVAGTATKGNATMADYCNGSAQVVEYSCFYSEGISEIVPVTIQCGANKTCEAGACIAKNVSPGNASLICTGLSEPDIYVKQGVTWNGTSYADLCVDYTTVKDYFCRDQKLSSINHECLPGYGCSDGQCNPLAFSCTETDSGNDTSLRGKTVVVRGLATLSEDSDICIDDQEIREYYCIMNGSSDYSEFPCESGKKCMDGRCVRSDCTETDDGRDIYHAGTTVRDDASNEDSCMDFHTVREYYCYGDEMRDDDISCGKGYICNEGKCVEGSIS
jgi:hypothetical protein